MSLAVQLDSLAARWKSLDRRYRAIQFGLHRHRQFVRNRRSSCFQRFRRIHSHRSKPEQRVQRRGNRRRMVRQHCLRHGCDCSVESECLVSILVRKCILQKPTTSWPKSMSFVSFPKSPVELCCVYRRRCTFSRSTLRRNSGCASKHSKLFRIEKVFLTLGILFRCYSCSAMDLLKWPSSCLARLAWFNKNATGSLRIGSGLKSLDLFMGIPGKMVANAAL